MPTTATRARSVRALMPRLCDASGLAQPLGRRLSRRPVPRKARAGVDADEVSQADLTGLAAAAPEIVAAVKRMLDGVRDGDLAPAPAEPVAAARTGWL